MDVLENIKDSQQDIMRLNRQVSPLQKMQDPDRITDYPRRPSPNVSMLSLNSRRSSLSSRRSSLSAMSQSSLTSDSSFDANKKPGKKILKNPHRSSRQSKNRVRWKLPNSDSDTMSVDSFESTTTVGSSVYNRAKSGVLTARQNWREFEQSPPRGSTGITPMKTATRQMRGSYSTGALHVHPYSPPGNLGTIPQDKVVSDLGSKSTQTLTTSKPTPSPLTYNTSANNSSSPGGLLHSTPIRHTQSASNIDFRRQMQLHKQSPNTTSDIRVPILRLDNSNLTDLEESTLEDKKRMHIFQFPQPSDQAQNSSRPVLASADLTRSKQSAPPPTTRTTAVPLDDDDANDYDHLSPLHENKVKKQEKSKEIKKDTDKSIYSDQDLDEALEVIAKESSTGGSGLPGISRTKKEEKPPLVPPKKHLRTRIGAVGSEATANVHRSDFINPKPPISTTAPSLTQTQSNHDTGRSSQGNDRRNSSVKSLQQVPPPIPPKMRRKKQQSTIFPPGSQSAKEAAYLPNHRQLRVQGGAVLPPAPEFPTDRQTRPNNSSPPQSHSSTEEDPMASESNSTLIEQEGTTPKGSKFNATPSPVGPAVVYPVTSQPVDNQQSWKPLELRDRIVVGAENPGPPVDKHLTTSSTNQLQNSRNMMSKPSMPSQDSYSQSLSQDMQYFQNNAFFAGSYSQPDTTRPSGFMVTSHYGQPARMSSTSRVGQTTRAPEEKSTVPTSPRYKFSLETALTEGNLMKSLSYAPQSHSVSASQPNETAATQRPQVLQRPRKSMTRSQSVGQSSRPAGLSNASLSSEEQYVRQRFYSGSKLPMDKPVVHVKDQSVSQLLRELDINDKKQTGKFELCEIDVLQVRHCRFKFYVWL